MFVNIVALFSKLLSKAQRFPRYISTKCFFHSVSCFFPNLISTYVTVDSSRLCLHMNIWKLPLLDAVTPRVKCP